MKQITRELTNTDFVKNTFIDAKGLDYAKLLSNQKVRPFVVAKAVKEAEGQIRDLALAGLTHEIEWHFAEKYAADLIREEFLDKGLNKIIVHYTPL